MTGESINEPVVQAIADRVLAAQDGARTIDRLTREFPALTIAESYAVQDELARRWVTRGARIVGRKAGLTSRAKMEQMGVHEPSFGILTNTMARPENGIIEMEQLVHPRVEAEIAFVMDRELGGPDHTIESVLSATDYIVPAIEIIDSRFEAFKFDLISVIADNGSCARYVTGGRPVKPGAVDLRTIGVVIERNGAIQAVGASAAVLNHPAHAVALLARHLAARGESLPGGSLILTGGITEAIPVSIGDGVTARFQDMGSISVRFA